MDQQVLFEDRFLESFVGSIVTDPAIAIVELVANCWDAYATGVKIGWPNRDLDKMFVIADKGIGMTRREFESRWRTFRPGPFLSIRQALGDEAAEGLAEHDRPDDAQRIAQPHHIIGKGVQCPLLRRTGVAAAMPAVIDIDHLGDVGELREQRLEAAVVVAGAARASDGRS